MILEDFVMIYFFILIFIALVVTNSASFKGKIGEKRVKNTIKKLNPTLYVSIHDLYIPIENGKKTSQVDHLVLSHKGIYVIETKNYKGWITGSEQSQYWNQTNYKRKDKFNNPLWQNYGHIQALKTYLGDLVENVPFFSIIVFGDQSELKFKSEFKNASVIKRNKLIGLINGSTNSNILSHQQLRKIQHKIEPLVNISNVEKNKVAKNHRSEIRSTLSQKKQSIKNNIFPRCGNPMVKRKGIYGEFKGCSKYPKCKFTA